MPAQLKGAITFPCNGKIPAVEGWQNLTESVPHTGNYGVKCGARSGVFVVDFDDLDALDALEAEHGRLPRTFMVATGRGAHAYFRHPGGLILNSASKLAPKVDVRGDGGQVIGPGSVHPTGAIYTPVDPVAEIADAPPWLLAWPGLRGKERARMEPGADAPQPVSGAERDRRLALYSAWLADQRPCISGEGGHNKLLNVAIRGVLYEALAFGDVREALEPYNSRCEPPWSDAEIDHKLSQALAKRKSVRVAFDDLTFDGRGAWEAFCERLAATSAVNRQEVANAPHVYTFDPLKEVVQPQFIKKKDGTEERRKTAKPHVSDLLFDLYSETDWVDVLRFNEFDKQIYAVRPPFRMDAERGAARLLERDLTGLRAWFLVRKYANPIKDDLQSVVETVAKAHAYHPIRDWLRALPATSTRHLDNLAATLFGDERPIAQEFVRKTLIAACARIMEPGCQVDHILTLYAPQGGEKKTSSCRALFKVPGCNAFRTDLPDLRDAQKVGQAVEGIWACELGEIDNVRRSEASTFKSFCTRLEERYSPKWVKGETRVPREFVLVATINEKKFLPFADPAFRRRFWTVDVTKRVDTDWIDAHREEIWSEAFALYRAGCRDDGKHATGLWWFEDEREADVGRHGFVDEDPMEDAVASYLARKQPGEFVATNDIARAVEGIPAYNSDQAPSKRTADAVARAMRALGHEPSQRKVDGRNARGWILNGDPRPVDEPETKARVADVAEPSTYGRLHLVRGQ
jgi:predicted P-loop ATPase